MPCCCQVSRSSLFDACLACHSRLLLSHHRRCPLYCLLTVQLGGPFAHMSAFVCLRVRARVRSIICTSTYARFERGLPVGMARHGQTCCPSPRARLPRYSKSDLKHDSPTSALYIAERQAYLRARVSSSRLQSRTQ